MKFEKIDKTEWQKILDKLDSYPPFYSPQWLESYEKLRKNYEIGAFLVDCGDFQFLFPYLTSSILLFKAVYSGPLGTYGGPVSIKGAPSGDCIQEFLNFLKKRFKKIVINFDPFNELQSFSFEGFKKIEGFTHVIDLDKENLLTDTFVRGAKKAKREGVTISDSPDFLKNFLDEFFKRKDWVDKRLIGKDFFFEDLVRKKIARLYTALYESKPIAHVFIVLGKNYAFYHYGISDRSFLHLRPNNLLHFRVIEDLKNMGFRYYNLGSSVGLPGVEKFKKRMGAKEMATITLMRSLL